MDMWLGDPDGCVRRIKEMTSLHRQTAPSGACLMQTCGKDTAASEALVAWGRRASSSLLSPVSFRAGVGPVVLYLCPVPCRCQVTPRGRAWCATDISTHWVSTWGARAQGPPVPSVLGVEGKGWGLTTLPLPKAAAQPPSVGDICLKNARKQPSPGSALQGGAHREEQPRLWRA